MNRSLFMRFDVITIFPESFKSYLNSSILKRAQDEGLVEIYLHNLRRWTTDKHQTVDDRPYGGGAGMIFLVEPLYKAVQELKKVRLKKKNSRKAKRRVILFSVKGEQFNQKKAEQYKHYDQIILIVPHYEGVDERVARYIADEEISLGNFILTSGVLPALAVIDAVTRLLPGVIDRESLKEESFYIEPEKKRGRNKLYLNVYEYPQYSRPAVFYPDPQNKRKAWRVPSVLLSGNHRKIEEWRKKHLKRRDK